MPVGDSWEGAVGNYYGNNLNIIGKGITDVVDSWTGTPQGKGPPEGSIPPWLQARENAENPKSQPIENGPTPNSFNGLTPAQDTSQEDALRSTYLNSLQPNYGQAFAGKAASIPVAAPAVIAK